MLRKLYRYGPFQVFALDANFEVVHALSCVNFERSLVSLVSNSVPDASSEHHLVASHVILHDVL